MRLKVRVMDSFLKRLAGLLFAARVDTALLFVFPQSGIHAIHSFFCPAFDAVFLDDACRVVDVFQVRHWGPWFAPRTPAKYLVEAEPGFAAGIRIGQTIRVHVNGAWLDTG